MLNQWGTIIRFVLSSEVGTCLVLFGYGLKVLLSYKILSRAPNHVIDIVCILIFFLDHDVGMYIYLYNLCRRHIRFIFEFIGAYVITTDLYDNTTPLYPM